MFARLLQFELPDQIMRPQEQPIKKRGFYAVRVLSPETLSSLKAA